MITKNDLIAHLERLYHEKKQAVPMYAQHLNDDSFLAQLKSEQREGIKSMLSILAEESRSHLEMFETVLKKVKGSDQDAY